MTIDTAGTCSVCGQRVRYDTIHTCSPQVAAPSGTTGSGSDATSDVRMAALRERAKRGVGLYGPGDIKDCFTVIDRERAARLAAERRAEMAEARLTEPDTDITGEPHVLDRHGIPWRERALARGNVLRYIAFVTTGDENGDVQSGVDALQRQNRELRELHTEMMLALAAGDWAERKEAVTRLRSRLADIDKGEG